jgi:glycine cleavage system H protein
MENIKYSKTHEYVRVTENNEAYIGISDYAQSELGEIVFIDFNVDNTLTKVVRYMDIFCDADIHSDINKYQEYFS